MSIIMGRGDDAKKAIEGKGGGLDLKKAFIRLKAGQSRKVRILSKFDYVAYKAHNHFANGIYTQPCIKVAGDRCLLCEAANYKGDYIGDLIDTVKNMKGEEVSEWASMYAKKRVLFAFVDLEEGEEGEDGNPVGMVRLFDATKNQADGLIATIDEYAGDLGDIAFTLKRTGERQDTTYSLNPIMPSRMKEIQSTFDLWDEKEVSDSLFEEALQARTTEEQAKELQKAGFPVNEVLGLDVKVEEDEGNVNEDEGEPITEDDPTNDF